MSSLQIELARTIQEDRLRETQRRLFVQEVLAGRQKQPRYPARTLVQRVRCLTKLDQRAVAEPAR